MNALMEAGPRETAVEKHGEVHGVAIAVVTQNKDDESQCRVKVRYPWHDKPRDSYWARLAMPMAGKDRGLVTIPEVRVGSATLRDVRTTVFDEAAVDAMLNGWRSDEPARGILGYEALAHHVLTVDYERDRLAITPAGAPPDPATTFDLAPLRGVPTLPVRVDGAQYRVIIDTGSSEGIYLSEDWEDDLHFRAGPTIVGYVMGASGLVAEHAGRLEGAIEIGGHRVDAPIVSLAAVPVCGAAYLLRFIVTLDVDASRGSLVQADSEPIEALPIRSFGFAWLHVGGVWRITRLIPGGHAGTAGIMVDDELLTIGGHTPEELASSWLGWEDIAPGDHTVVRVRRGDEEVSIDLPIAILVP